MEIFFVKRIFAVVALVFSWVWKILSTGATVAINLVFLVSLLAFASLFIFRPETEIPNESALILAPEGNIVEGRSTVDPLTRVIDRLAGITVPQETPLQDILDAIDNAAVDDRIKMLVIAPSSLGNAGFNQLRDIGRSIERFKNSGKIVVAADNAFNQSQYYLAAHADEIYLNPMGNVDLHGFGVFRLYFKELLDKLDINFHVFKVGEFKSALEPFLRDDMSPAAKEANRQWLGNLWDTYCRDIGKQRGLTVQIINDFINTMDQSLQRAKGDTAVMALNAGLIDGLKTRQQLEDYLGGIVGKGENGVGFNHVTLYNYLKTVTPSYTSRSAETPAVGIIVAEGNIVTGPGNIDQIGAESLIRKIQKARLDNTVKAVVLRIDSGGGSAFASELIRQELILTRNAGKPVVISMGSMAASGAYWLSADADAIVASPVTLTGSIGIFGALPTFEETLARAGIYNDGIGTTSIAGGFSPTRDLTPALSRVLQLNVEQGYRQFISIVAKGRGMPVDKVERIAEGRVWDGTTAMKLGLVDEIGSMRDAVDRAAKLAGLSADTAVYIDLPSPFISRLHQLGGAVFSEFQNKNGTAIPSTLSMMTEQAMGLFNFIYKHPDPSNLYAHCLLSSSTIDF